MSNILNTRVALDVGLLVDRYRHEHAAIEQHLSQYESTDGLEAAFLEWYERQGITNVPAEVIRAGIEEYERNRFVCPNLKAKGLNAFIINKYLDFKTPGKHTRPLFFEAILAILAILAIILIVTIPII